MVAAILGLGCAGDIWYLDPDVLSGNNAVSAPPAVAARSQPRCGPAPKPFLHRVGPGETLSDMARWYGLPVTAFARENEIPDPDRIAAGTVLRIPPGARTGCPPPATIARAPRPPEPGTESSPQVTREEPERNPESFQAQSSLPSRADSSLASRDDSPLPTRAESPIPSRMESSVPSRAETSLPAARRMVERAQSSYDAADFEASLELAKSSLHLLESEPEGPESARLEARAAWIAGLCYTALGRREPAVASFRSALDQDPSLADQESMSPKVRSLVESARVAVAAPL